MPRHSHSVCCCCCEAPAISGFCQWLQLVSRWQGAEVVAVVMEWLHIKQLLTLADGGGGVPTPTAATAFAHSGDHNYSPPLTFRIRIC